MQEIHVRSLSSEDPLEEEIATHSSILAWTHTHPHDKRLSATWEASVSNLIRAYQPLDQYGSWAFALTKAPASAVS